MIFFYEAVRIILAIRMFILIAGNPQKFAVFNVNSTGCQCFVVKAVTLLADGTKWKGS